MTRFKREARILALSLGLGDLNHRPPCHGYANACHCDECRERENNTRLPRHQVRQPWEPAA